MSQAVSNEWKHDHFFAAPFAIDGELVAIGEWQLSDLAPHWLAFCRELLALGANFQTSLPEPFTRLELKFTSIPSAALATFRVKDQLASSAVYLRGDNPDAERELLAMFVESLRRTDCVQKYQSDSEPFAAVYGLRQRPLHVVVSWANPSISDQDQGLVSELGNHFAASFLCRRVPEVTTNSSPESP